MEPLGSTDIFATKGIEYLIVIAYLALLIGFWQLLRTPRVAVAARHAAHRVGSALRGLFEVRDDRYFHQGHTWVGQPQADIVRVGIDDFAQKLVGAPDGFDLPSVGSTVRQGMRAWRLQVDDRQLDMLSPIDGEVVGVNQAVLDSPTIVSEDPYDRGWLLEVRVPERATFTNLLSGPLAHAWMEQAAERVKTMQPEGLGVLLADGGAPIAGFGRALRPDDWDELARDFFLTR